MPDPRTTPGPYRNAVETRKSPSHSVIRSDDRELGVVPGTTPNNLREGLDGSVPVWPGVGTWVLRCRSRRQRWSAVVCGAKPSKAPAWSMRLADCSVGGGRRLELAVTLLVDHQLVLWVDVVHGISLFCGFE